MGHRFSSVWVQFVVCVTVFPKVVKWVKFQKFKLKKKKKEIQIDSVVGDEKLTNI